MWGWSLGMIFNLISAFLPPPLQRRSERKPRINLRAGRDIKEILIQAFHFAHGETEPRRKRTNLRSHNELEAEE